MYKLMTLLLCISFFATSCGDKKKSNKPSDTKIHEKFYSNRDIQKLVQENKLVIVDDLGHPVANANVLIGYELNKPFQNNFLKTNELGILDIPKEWQEPLPVTIDLQGYLRVTYLDQTPGGVYFRLKKKRDFPQNEIYGVTEGHDIKNYDDQMDFGLVVECMNKEDLLTFDINKVISPLSDVMSVVGFDLTVPGNISIPQQKESYVIPLTLSKPQYRIKTTDQGKKRLLGLRGRFPFKTMVDAVRGGKNYADMVNLFNLAGGVLQEVNVTQDRTQVNLNTKQMNFTAQSQIVAPTINQQEVFLAVGASENNGAWFPTDIKRLESKQQQKLNLLPNSDSFLIGLIKNKNEFNVTDANASRMSAVIAAIKPNMTFELLPLIENPKILSANEFNISKPNRTTQNINETGTYAVISATSTLRSDIGEMQVVLAREWEIYTTQWIDHIKLPQLPNKEERSIRRLEVSFMGSTTTRDIEPGSTIIENATHVTRSAIDF